MKRKLHDIRESKVWQEAYAEGAASSFRRSVQALAERMTLDEIAELLDEPLDDIRRAAEQASTEEAS